MMTSADVKLVDALKSLIAGSEIAVAIEIPKYQRIGRLAELRRSIVSQMMSLEACVVDGPIEAHEMRSRSDELMHTICEFLVELVNAFVN